MKKSNLFGNTPPRCNLVDWDDVQIEPVRWLMTDLLPFAELTIIEGAGGIGKTTTVLDIIARLSRGRAMPDGTPCEPGNALIIASEEDRTGILKARLLAHDADLNRVSLIKSIGADDHWFSLPTDAPAIMQAVQEWDARFVFIDALFSHLDAELSPYKPQDVRRVLRPLSEIAHDTGASVVAIRHWGKAARSAADRGLGSADIRNVARCVLTAGPHPSDEGRFVVAVAKTNLGKPAAALTYSIESAEISADAGPVNVGRIAWGDRAQITADDLASDELPNADEQTRVQVAMDLLQDRLGEGEALPSEALYAEAKQRGLSATALKRAAKRLGIVHGRSGYPARTTWRLPGSGLTGAQSEQVGSQSAHTRRTGLTGPTAQSAQSAQSEESINIHAHAREDGPTAPELSVHSMLCSRCKSLGRCHQTPEGVICERCSKLNKSA